MKAHAAREAPARRDGAAARSPLPRPRSLPLALAVACAGLASLAMGCPSAETRDDEPMTEARALRAVQDAIDCAYKRTPYDNAPRPDALVYAIDREAVSFSWTESTELRRFMKLRWNDLLDVNVVKSRKFPDHDPRADIIVAVRDGSQSARELQEMGAQRLRRLFDRVELTFPLRPLAMADAFRDGALWLAIRATGPEDRVTPLVASPSERPGFSHTRVTGMPIEEPDTSTPSAPGRRPSRRIDEPQSRPATTAPSASPAPAPAAPPAPAPAPSDPIAPAPVDPAPAPIPAPSPG